MHRPYDKVQDECLDRLLQGGEGVEACVADYPEYAAELREALEAARGVHDAFAFQPDAARKRASRLRYLDKLERSRRPRGLLGGLARRLSWGGRRWALTTTALVAVMVLGGTGTVLGAEGSVPGDPLYPVKRVGERARLLFTFSDSGESELRASLMERRMKEVEAVMQRGRSRFVSELLSQVELHAQHASRLAVAPVDEVVPSSEAIAASMSEQAIVSATPGPLPTPVRGALKTVRADRLLELNDQIERMEQRVRHMSERAFDAHTQRSFLRLQESLGADLRHGRGVLKRAEEARNLVHQLQQEAGLTGASSEEAEQSYTITVLQYVPAEVVGVELVRVDGGVRVDLIVVGPEGRRQVVHLMPGAARLLRGSLPGALEDLRIHGAVQLAVDPATGEVRQVRTLPGP